MKDKRMIQESVRRLSSLAEEWREEKRRREQRKISQRLKEKTR